MIQKLTLRVLPAVAEDAALLTAEIARTAGVGPAVLSGFNLIKKSIDARGRNVHISVTVEAAALFAAGFWLQLYRQ